MKKRMLFVAIVAFFTSISVVKAQGFSFYSKETLDAISASPAQREKVLEIQKNAEEQIAVIKRCPTATSEEKKAKIREISQERGKAYAAALTRAQMVKVSRLRREYTQQQAKE